MEARGWSRYGKVAAMKRLPHTRSVLAFLVFFSFSLGAWACDDDEPVVQEDPGPIVAPMGIPISLRQDTGIPDGVHVEVGTSRVRVNGTTVQKIDAGKLVDKAAEGAASEEAPLVGLSGALANAPGLARISMHVNTPYSTMVEVLDTLHKAGVRKFAFQVRAPGETQNTSWMVLENLSVEDPPTPPAEGEVETPHPKAPQWDAFVKHWQAINDACRANHYVDCDARQEHVEEGGKLRINMLARGSALQVEFERYGAAKDEGAPVGGGGGDMLEGLAPEPSAEEVVEKRDRAVFTWRFAGATDAESPIGPAFSPICKTRECPVRFRADAKTPSMRVLSFVGAAFPSGSEEPLLTLIRPEG